MMMLMSSIQQIIQRTKIVKLHVIVANGHMQFLYLFVVLHIHS